MQDSAVMLHCSNPGCQAANPLDGQFCHQCHTPLIRRYLWAIGEGVEAYSRGQLVSDRYLWVGSQVVLDSKPALPPPIFEDIPPEIFVYLKLFPYRPHIPQVYGQLAKEDGANSSGLWLLEYGSLPEAESTKWFKGQIFPELKSAWSKTSPLRQLNWLAQILQLWRPLHEQGVASSLLAPALLRVNGPLFLLRELRADDSQPPSLAQLGQLWSQWSSDCATAIQPFYRELCGHLIAGRISQPEDAIAILDRALAECGTRSTRSYEIYSCTDTGPSRKHNEDACYPRAGQLTRCTEKDTTLAIVCDGIGGHEGGEIASRIAIDTVRDKLADFYENSKRSGPNQAIDTLEEAVCDANDAISYINDSEQRHDRQRMGTTLILTLAHTHQMYLSHVGDSRIYWVTRTGCYQVTLDDDWASWEVRLGYTLYRQAVQHYNAGALLQALGMSSSSRLRPTVNRITLDEDSVFLLCSDGLSDFDRVEQYWETEILPLLDGRKEIAKVSDRLIQLANSQNGHDNVTVALVYCRVKPAEGVQDRPISLPQLQAIAPPRSGNTLRAKAAQTQTLNPSEVPTQPPPQKSGLGRLLWASILLLLLGGGLGAVSYLFFPEVRSRVNALRGLSEQPVESASPTPSSPEASSEAIPSSALAVGTIIEIQEAIALHPQPSPLPAPTPEPSLPPQSQLKVVNIVQPQAEAHGSDGGPWLKLQVCTPRPQNSPPQRQTAPLETGWIRADDAAIASARQLTEAAPETCPTPALPNAP